VAQADTTMQLKSEEAEMLLGTRTYKHWKLEQLSTESGEFSCDGVISDARARAFV
jgi:hypothetical protein